MSSGTAALHLGVRAQGWGAGDEVVTSPFSFVASANCLLYEGATPVFCDIDPRTLNMDPQAAAAACGERTAGLLPIHIFGYPADMPSARGARARPRARASSRTPARRSARSTPPACSVGARGNPATFAFYANKQLVTGEGGMLTSGDDAVLEQARSERNQGRGNDMDWLSHDRLGFNYRMSDVTAAIGVAQLERARRPAGRARAGGVALPRAAGVDRRARAARARTRAPSAAAGSSTWCSCRTAWTATA